MIIYCGLRHFYIHHFAAHQLNTYYILTHNKDIWDYSPELRKYGFSNLSNPQSIRHLQQPVVTIPINLTDYKHYAEQWHDFSLQYTDELEIEYPHAWYLRFRQPIIAKQFSLDFATELKRKNFEGIWGGGHSKLVAKLAAHNLIKGQFISVAETQKFLNKLPLHRLPLPELEQLEKLGLKTIGELAKLSPSKLAEHFRNKAPILQKLGRGEDLVPFQTEKIQEYSWSLDCTTLAEFLRPLNPRELLPYLEQGLVELAAKLHAQHKVTKEIKLEAHLVNDGFFQKSRVLKQATNEQEVLLRITNALIPQNPIKKISVFVKKLEPATTTQLNMFLQENPKQVDFIIDDNFHIQVGIELSRREQFLTLWKESFKDE